MQLTIAAVDTFFLARHDSLAGRIQLQDLRGAKRNAQSTAFAPIRIDVDFGESFLF
jgi:hypothetical protein